MPDLKLPSQATPSLRQALEPQTALFNQAFRTYQSLYPGLDGGTAGRWFLFWAERILPTRPDAPLLRLWETVLGLWGKGFLAEPGFGEALATMAISPQAFAEDPGSFLAEATNLLVKLRSRKGSTERFLRELEGLALRDSDRGTLRKIWLVAAWKAGLSAWREEALAQLARLPGEIRTALAGGQSWESLEANPWLGYTGPGWTSVGAFSGWGGEFPEPPVLGQENGQLLAKSAHNVFLLRADGFGSTLIPLRRDATEPFKILLQDSPPSSEIFTRFGIRTETFTSSCAYRGAFCFTTSLHHKVFLLPLEPKTQSR